MKRYIYSLMVLILCAVGGNAQDSTFHMTRAAEIIIPVSADTIYSFQNFASADLDWDGKLEIVFSATVYVSQGGDVEDMHTIGIIRDGETITHSEFRPHSVRTPLLMIADLDEDGRIDIAYEDYHFRTFEVYSVPDLELRFSREYCFNGRYMVDFGDVWVNEEGEHEFVFTQHYLNSISGESWERSYGQARILTGSPLEGYPEHFAWICSPSSFILKEREDGSGTDYFAAGQTNHHFISTEDGMVEEETNILLMNTSYRGDLRNPDSLMVYQWNEMNIEAEDSIRGFVWSRHAVVEDLDADGDLEWVAPWYDVMSIDTSFTHIQIYDPAELELIDELVIGTEGLDIRNIIPSLCRGVKAIDIDRDGDWELLVYIANEPLMVIDPETMEIIMTSDQIVESLIGAKCHTYEMGHFMGEGENLQILAQSHKNRILIYNLPEEWTNYYGVKEQSTELVKDFRIIDIFPNPFNSFTTVRYSLPNPDFISLRIYNPLGQQVFTVFEGNMPSGFHSIGLNSETLPSGLYFIRLKSWENTAISRMVLVK